MSDQRLLSIAALVIFLMALLLPWPILALASLIGPSAGSPEQEPPQPLRWTRCSIHRLNIRPIRWAKSTWVLLSTESISIEVIGKVLIGP